MGPIIEPSPKAPVVIDAIELLRLVYCASVNGAPSLILASLVSVCIIAAFVLLLIRLPASPARLIPKHTIVSVLGKNIAGPVNIIATENSKQP